MVRRAGSKARRKRATFLLESLGYNEMEKKVTGLKDTERDLWGIGLAPHEAESEPAWLNHFRTRKRFTRARTS